MHTRPRIHVHRHTFFMRSDVLHLSLSKCAFFTGAGAVIGDPSFAVAPRNFGNFNCDLGGEPVATAVGSEGRGDAA